MAIGDGHIKFRHLVCFLEVVKRGNIGRAAEALNIAQPALSRSLSELEEIVSAKLLARGRRGSRLTAAGEAFFRYAAPGVSQIRQAYAAAAPGAGDSETIAIGVLPEAIALLPAAMTSMRERAPSAVLRVLHGTNADHLMRLRHGELALVVGRIAAADQLIGLSFEHLYSEAVACVVAKGHPLATAAPMAPADLAARRIVLHQPDTIVRAEIDRFLFAQGITELRDRFETDSMELARRLTLDDARIWIAPMGAVARDIADGALVALTVRDWHIAASVGITTDPKRKLTRNAEIFVDILREAARGE